MNLKTLLFISGFLIIISCKETTESIIIEKSEKEIPVQVLYSSKEKKIYKLIFYFSFKISNKSIVDRKLRTTYFKSTNDRTTNSTLNNIDGKFAYDRPIIKKGYPLNIVTKIKAITKKDSILTISDINTLPDSLKIMEDGDTIKWFSFKTISELQKEMPKLLYTYIKETDSICFEFDDAQLPFYVKRSKFNQKLNGKHYEIKLNHPWITVPIFENNN